MRVRGRVLLLMTSTLVTSTQAQTGTSVTLDVSPVHTELISAQPGQTITIVTRNPSAGAIPVLHLLREPAGTEVATAHLNAPGNQASIRYRVPFTNSGPPCRPDDLDCEPELPDEDVARRFRLVVRSYNEANRGDVDLVIGTRAPRRIRVEGQYARFPSMRRDDVIFTAALPSSPAAFTTYVLGPTGNVVRRAAGGQSPRVYGSSAPSALFAVLVAGQSGNVRVVRNDLMTGHDPDGDGLGRELEDELGTCTASNEVATNWECSRSHTPRDTDGDGLSDGMEYLGASALPLPKWGADPLHKDLFVEVDFMQRSQGEMVVRAMPQWVQTVAAIFADQDSVALYRLLHATSLKNPDRESGIRLHFDIGVNPPAGAPISDRTLYGDWGGFSIIPPVCDANGCAGMDAMTAYNAGHISSNRKGVFRYAPTYPGGGGQCSGSPTPVCPLPLGSAVTAAHELAHTFGLGHSGGTGQFALDANCKANYPSLMNYADQQRGFRGFSDGYGRPGINNARLNEGVAAAAPNSTRGREFLRRLRDVFDLPVDTVTGRVDWNSDGVLSNGYVSSWVNRTSNQAGCEFSRVNRFDIDVQTRSSPALVRVGSQVLAYYLINGAIHVARASNVACSGAIVDCPSPFVLTPIVAPWNSGIDAFDAQRWVNTQGRSTVLLAYRRGTSLRYVVSSDGIAWPGDQALQVSADADGELSLGGPGSTLYLAWVTTARMPRISIRLNGQWRPDREVRTAAGPIGPLGAGTSPALTHFDGLGNRSPQIYGVFPGAGDPSRVDDDGALTVYQYTFSTNIWTALPWQPTAEPSTGKPSIAITPVDAASPMPGKFYLFYLRRHATETRVRETSLRFFATSNTVRFTPPVDHDNTWFYGFGMDLMYEPGVDSNLRALIAARTYPGGTEKVGPLQLRWAADGVVDFTQRDWDDWSSLGKGLCQGLRGPIPCEP